MSDEQKENTEAQQPPVEMEGGPDAAQPIMEGVPGDEMEAGAPEQVPVAAPEQ